jgi:hypothetical protein
MRIALVLVLIIYLPVLVACQSDNATLPTLANLADSTPISRATATLIAPSVQFIATLPPRPTPIVSPTQLVIPLTPTFGITLVTLAPPTPLPTATLTPLPTITNTPLPTQFIFGYSVQGRELMAYRYGIGAQTIMLIGGIHAGYERNTTDLLNQVRLHIEANPQDIAPNTTFLIVPLLNPDGYTQGESLAGRFNANGVDLNRNWGCEWQAEAQFQDMTVSAGSEPFSEAETRALGALIQQVRPSVVLFYHAAANGVFAGGCNDTSVSQAMSVVYGEAADYPTGQDFTAYRVTGTAPNWVDSLGIPSADVELATSDSAELIRNVRGILAVQAWLNAPQSP